MNLDQLLGTFQAFKTRLFYQAFMDLNNNSFEDFTNFSIEERESLAQNLSWEVFVQAKVFAAKAGDTFKAVLETVDGLKIESVLMENSRGAYTICVSSQVGCAMACTFCATGTMGLKRSLTSLEILAQYRFWANFIAKKKLDRKILNMVFMGMGEPLANYINVRNAINVLLDLKLLGPTRITVSTVGVIPALERILTDEKWPNVRIAISLHSADPKKRRAIVPTTVSKFHQKLLDWSRKYFAKFKSNRLQVTFEYTLIAGVNDSQEHAQELAEYVRKFGRAKINVIPLNKVQGQDFMPSQRDTIEEFKHIILKKGIDVTQRKTMGEDIQAACGQLAVNN